MMGTYGRIMTQWFVAGLRWQAGVPTAGVHTRTKAPSSDDT